jgi:LysM repeat protein
VQEQVDDQDLAGLARPRVPAARPVASVDPTVLGPAPAPLDCPYLHLDDDGPSCLALPPAIRLSRRQVEIVCAVAAHVACPRLIKAEAGRVPVAVDPPEPVVRRRDRSAPDGPPVPPVPVAAAAFAPIEPPATPRPMPEPTPEPVSAGPTEVPVELATIAEPIPDVPTPRDPTPAVEPPARAAADVPAVIAPESVVKEPAPEASSPAVTERVAAAVTFVLVAARKHIVLQRATALAWLIVLAAVIVVIAVLSARGGLSLPAAATASPGVAAASPSVASPSASPTASPSPSPSPSRSPSPSVAPSPSAVPSTTPSVSPSPSTPFTPEQLAVLKPCPGKPDCYQYRIKSGDNLHNIATFFGVTYPALLAANSQITNPSIIHVGQQVIIPFPTPPKATPTPKP